jgi:hydroxyacylglutathione hydrolase
MKVDWVTVGPFQENSYLLTDPVTRHGVLVDPGYEASRIVGMVRAAQATVDAIWLTHAHLDHVGAVAEIKRTWNVPVYLHSDDLVLYRRAAEQAAFYGFPLEQPGDPENTLADCDQLSIGTTQFRVHHTPGHSPGHVVFVSDKVMIGGDLLFAGSIGRTDLPLSNSDAMDASLQHIATFDADTVVYPGHGPPTQIGVELATNPFLVAARTSL